MAFTVAYDIKAVDKFTDVANKVHASMARMDRTMRKVITSNDSATRSFRKMSTAATAGVGRVNRSIDKTGRSSVKSGVSLQRFNSALGGLGGSAQRVGSILNRSVTLPLLAAGVASSKIAVDFNKGMANVGTLIPGQRKRLEGLKATVLDMAQELGTSAEDLQGGLYQTLSAFGTIDDPTEKLRLSAKMAKAGMASVTESLNLVSAVTKGYGDTSDKAATQVANMAFQAVKDGQTTFPELAASMGRVVPIAAAMGVKQRELFSEFATLTGVTGTAAEVSTQLAAAMRDMAKPTTDMQRVIKKLGYSSGAAMVKQLGLQGALKKVYDQVGGNTASLSKLMGRKEGLIAALALAGKQSDTFRKKYQRMGDVTTALNDAFKEQTENINKSGHSFDKTREKLKALAGKIGDKLLPVIERLVDKYIIPLVDKLSNMDDATLESTLKFAAFAAMLGPVISGLGKTMSAVSGTITMIGNLKTAGAGAVKMFERLPPMMTGVQKGANGTARAMRATGVAFGAATAAAMAYYAIKASIEKSEARLKKTEDLRQKARLARNKASSKGATLEDQKRALAAISKLKREAIADTKKSMPASEVIAFGLGNDSAIRSRAATVRHLWKMEAELEKKIQKNRIASDQQAHIKQMAEKYNVDPMAIQMRMPGGTMAAAESRVKVDIQLNAPEGTVADVKQKSSGNGHARVNVGKNARL